MMGKLKNLLKGLFFWKRTFPYPNLHNKSDSDKRIRDKKCSCFDRWNRKCYYTDQNKQYAEYQIALSTILTHPHYPLLVPHCGQNLPFLMNLKPHLLQVSDDVCGLPHSSQNIAPGVSSAPHWSQNRLATFYIGLLLIPANESVTALLTIPLTVPPMPDIMPKPSPMLTNSPTPSFCAAFSAISRPRSYW